MWTTALSELQAATFGLTIHMEQIRYFKFCQHLLRILSILYLQIYYVSNKIPKGEAVHIILAM